MLFAEEERSLQGPRLNQEVLGQGQGLGQVLLTDRLLDEITLLPRAGRSVVGMTLCFLQGAGWCQGHCVQSWIQPGHEGRVKKSAPLVETHSQLVKQPMNTNHRRGKQLIRARWAMKTSSWKSLVSLFGAEAGIGGPSR